MDEKRIAEKVARSLTSGISWTGSGYEDLDKAGEVVAKMGKDMKSIMKMVVEEADDLADDFESHNDDTYVRYARDASKKMKKLEADLVKVLWRIQREVLGELKGQIEHFSDIM